tara:strand:+ start:1032 stop:2504 length:1473 start_codon:yes stop_codon:yes gene_type:complete
MAATKSQILSALIGTRRGSREESNLLRDLRSVDPEAHRNYVAKLKPNTTGQGKGLGDTAKGATALKNVGKELVDVMGKLKGGLNDVEQAAVDIFTSDKPFSQGIRSVGGLLKTNVDLIEGYRIQLNKLNVGESRAYILSLRQQQNTLSSYNIEFKNLVGATQNIREGLNELTFSTFKDNQEALTKLIVVNQKFGVSQFESIDLLNNLNKGFNLSGQGADKFSRTLLTFARQTGQPFNKVFQDFNSSIDKFFVTLDSSKALKRFSVFQQAARTLGTSVGGLLGVVDKFDTIEGGFELGGQINMLLSNLGGSFDAQQAILMSRPERLRYLAESIAGVGGRIKGMSELGQRALIRQLSSTTGFDVATIRGFIDKGMGPELDRLLEKSDQMTAMTAKDQKQLADENTTREERRQITNDKLINKQTVATEKLVSNLEALNQTFQQQGLDKIAGFMDTIQKNLEIQQKALIDQIRRGVSVKVTGVNSRKADLPPGS